MAVPQITVRLLPELKMAFEAYSDSLGLDASELAKLLVVREKKLRRLVELKKNGCPPKRPRQPRGEAIQPKTITAHLSSLAQVNDFHSYAKKCGLSRSAAGVWLLEREISERWLQRALSMK